uniref:Cappuccino-like protein n=2 Tax=Callorhinchus milii TaxID=7868 RepID=V9KSU9_CALMI
MAQQNCSKTGPTAPAKPPAGTEKSRVSDFCNYESRMKFVRGGSGQQQQQQQQGGEGGEDALRSTARSYAAYLTADAHEEVQQLESSLEEMLIKVDEFCGMLDMIRNDSSQVVNENIPQIHKKADEMRQMYKKIDKLEVFVKMIGQNVGALDEQVTQAEAELGMFPNAFKKILHSFSAQSFLNKSSSPKKQQRKYEPASLFKTEDYFPAEHSQSQE